MDDRTLRTAFERMERDPMAWGQFLFGHHFKKESPDFHYELIEAAMKYQYLAIASPRRSAKSTYLSFLYPFHKIMFKKEPFIVLISNTFKKAAMYLDAIKIELQSNELLRETFPSVVMSRDAEGDTIFKHEDGFSTLFLCKGVDQLGSIRGVKYGANRPGLILIDDMEDDVLVKSSERRTVLKEDFDAVLGQVGHAATQHIVVGTILHDDSQLAKLVSKDQYQKFHKIIFRAHIKPDTVEERSLWPEEWSLDYLRELRRTEPNVYAKEMQNDPVAGSNTRFKKEDFRYWKFEENCAVLLDGQDVVSKYDLKDLKAAISCDLAWTEKREADLTVLMPGFLTPNSEILVDSYIKKKSMRPDELANQLFVMSEKLRLTTGTVVPVGFEKAMLENVTQWILKREMKARGEFLLTKELIWDADKNTRIETRLQPRYVQHIIYHKHGMGDLEFQLERFPYGSNDDLCLAEGTLIATPFGVKNIENIKVGDLVLTPSGFQKVDGHSFTGYKPIISKFGLNATSNHLILSKKSGIVSIDALEDEKELYFLTWKDLTQWRYRKLLFSMESLIDSWVARENIISVNQRPILQGKIRRDFMWRFGNMLTKGKFLKAFMFIISMEILLITTFLTLFVYQRLNILNYLKKLIILFLKSIWIKLDHWLQNGIDLMKVIFGMLGMRKMFGLTEYQTNYFANSAEDLSSRFSETQNTARNLAEIKKNGELKKVYNLSVKNEKVYYANGVLVSNCDALQGLVQLLQHPKEAAKRRLEETEFDRVRKLTIESKLPKKPAHRYSHPNNRKWSEIPALKSFR